MRIHKGQQGAPSTASTKSAGRPHDNCMLPCWDLRVLADRSKLELACLLRQGRPLANDDIT
eukprot:1155858-Pelagomonas_calceolata.AAC.1